MIKYRVRVAKTLRSQLATYRHALATLDRLRSIAAHTTGKWPRWQADRDVANQLYVVRDLRRTIVAEWRNRLANPTRYVKAVCTSIKRMIQRPTPCRALPIVNGWKYKRQATLRDFARGMRWRYKGEARTDQTLAACIADPIASIPALRAALDPARGKVSVLSVRATVAAWRGASVARIADPIRLLRPAFAPPARTAAGLRQQAQAIRDAKADYDSAVTTAEYMQCLLEQLAESFASEPQRQNPDLSDVTAEYRARKALTPYVQAFARRVEGCKREAVAARLTLADATSGRERKRLATVVHQRDKALAAAVDAFHRALDLACERQGLPMFVVRPDDRSVGFRLTDNGSWAYDYKHHSGSPFVNAEAKPWQV